MGKRLFQLTSGLIRIFSHRMKTEWEVPFEEGPCIFVTNNVGFMGPVEMITKFSERERCHPWINDELLEAGKIPAYARRDCWWKPGSFFEPVLNVTVPYIAAAVIPPLLKSVPYVSVYHDQRIMLTLRQSIRVMQKDESLIIFPETPNARLGRHEWISTGWLRLGEMWYRTCGRALKMYPVHIDRDTHVFKVAAPVYYDPARRYAEQERELTEALMKGMRGR